MGLEVHFTSGWHPAVVIQALIVLVGDRLIGGSRFEIIDLVDVPFDVDCLNAFEEQVHSEKSSPSCARSSKSKSPDKKALPSACDAAESVSEGSSILATMVRLPLVQVAVPGMAGAVPLSLDVQKETVYCLRFSHPRQTSSACPQF